MSDKEIINKLKNILSSVMNIEIDIDENNINNYLLRDLGVNSIGLIYLSIAIEEAFNIDMSNVTFDSFKTINDVIQYIKEAL